MKFYDHLTMWDLERKLNPGGIRDYKTFYLFLLEKCRMGALGEESQIGHDQFVHEARWYEDNQPYYNVWHGIVKPLCRVDLDAVKCEDVQLPRKVLLFRFAENKHSICFVDEQTQQTHELLTVLVAESETVKNVKALTLWMDFGEGISGSPIVPRIPIYTFQNLPMVEGTSIEQAIHSLKVHPSLNMGLKIPREIVHETVKLVISCCLLSTDAADELIEPDVLAKDRENYWRTRDEKYVERARRRGKVGWDIGRHIEVNPHYRKPHLCLFHTGKGRQNKIIKMRKGAIIHKEIVKKIPTGEKLDLD